MKLKKMKLKRFTNFINESIFDQWNTSLTININNNEVPVYGRISIDTNDIEGELIILQEDLLKIGIKSDDDVLIWNNCKEYDNAEWELDSSDAWGLVGVDSVEDIKIYKILDDLKIEY